MQQGNGGGKDPLGENAYERIRQAIGSGDLKPGTRVTENEIADWLNMSRTPVREAILRLEGEGLLTYASRHGLRVAELDYHAVIELYAMREVLEGTAARLAALHASHAEIETLRELLETERAAAGAKPENLAKINRQFHRLIYHGAHNRYLLKSVTALSDAMMLLGTTTLAAHGRHESALKEHAAIFDAIEQRDPDKAETEAKAHIREAQRQRVKMIIRASAEDEGDIPSTTDDNAIRR